MEMTLDDLTAREHATSRRRAYIQWILAKGLAPTTADALFDFERRVGSRSPHLAVMQKAAVAPNESSADWDGIRNLSDQFLALVRPLTLLGQMSPFVRRTPANTPVLVQAGGTTATFVGEGLATPVSAPMDLTPVTLRALKLGLIGITTIELAKRTDAAALAVVERDLAVSIARGENAVILDALAAVPTVRPAGLLFGVSPVGSGSPADTEADAKAMFSVVSGGEPAAPFFIASAMGAVYLAGLRNSDGELVFPGASLKNGNIFGVPLLVSPAAGPNLILIDAASLLIVDEGLEITGARNATLQLDTAPDNPATGATVLVSLFQKNLLGLKVLRFVNWELAHADAISFVTLPV